MTHSQSNSSGVLILIKQIFNLVSYLVEHGEAALLYFQFGLGLLYTVHHNTLWHNNLRHKDLASAPSILFGTHRNTTTIQTSGLL